MTVCSEKFQPTYLYKDRPCKWQGIIVIFCNIMHPDSIPVWSCGLKLHGYYSDIQADLRFLEQSSTVFVYALYYTGQSCVKLTSLTLMSSEMFVKQKWQTFAGFSSSNVRSFVDFLSFVSSILNIFWFWALGWTTQALWRYHLMLLKCATGLFHLGDQINYYLCELLIIWKEWFKGKIWLVPTRLGVLLKGISSVLSWSLFVVDS